MGMLVFISVRSLVAKLYELTIKLQNLRQAKDLAIKGVHFSGHRLGKLVKFYLVVA